jgi:hypothetical protein
MLFKTLQGSGGIAAGDSLTILAASPQRASFDDLSGVSALAAAARLE